MSQRPTSFSGETYNALGWMVNSTPSSGTSQDMAYLPNGQVEGIFNGNGGSNWWYEQNLWLGHRLLAYYDPNWNTYFIHRGANGSSTQITNESGGLAGDMLFYPFGQEWQYDNGVNAAWWQFYNSFSRWNANLGFDLTPNRKYSPTLGRWMTPDPAGMAAASPSNPQTWNMYAYVLNNPTSLVDTSGLKSSCTDSSSSVDIVGGKFFMTMKKCKRYAPVPLDMGSLYHLAVDGIVSELGGSGTTAVGAGGGGVSPPVGGPVPSYGQVLKSFNNCAANFADKHSVASMLHLNNVPIVGTVLGSSTAAISNLVFRTNPEKYVSAGTSLATGVKAGAIVGGAATTAGNVPIDQGFQSIFTTVSPTKFGETIEGGSIMKGAEAAASALDKVAVPLALWDEAMYGIGEGVCTAQAF